MLSFQCKRDTKNKASLVILDSASRVISTFELHGLYTLGTPVYPQKASPGRDIADE